MNALLCRRPIPNDRSIRIATVVFLVFYLVYHYVAATKLGGPDDVRPTGGQSASFDPIRSLLVRGNVALKEVALTVDDGPHELWAPQILDALKKNKVHATFFVVGRKVQAHPDLARRILAGGNELGNHSMTHPRFDTLSTKGVRKELARCARAVFDATGTTMRLMRPPGLRYTDEILQVARSMHYITAEENIAVGDYILPGDRSWYRGSPTYAKHVSDVERNVFKQLKNGAIIVLHDMPVTADALDSILKGIKRRGYSIVTVSKMLAHLGGPPATNRNGSPVQG